LVEWLAGRAVY